MVTITKFDISVKFSDLYPELAQVFPKLKDEELWALAFYTAPNSPFKNFLGKDKKQAIEDLFGKKLNWDKLEKAEGAFSMQTQTKPQRLLSLWEKELEDRFALIAEIDYRTASKEMIELKEKILGNTYRMWEQYEKFLKSVMNEQESKLVGEAKESLLDSNDI